MTWMDVLKACVIGLVGGYIFAWILVALVMGLATLNEIFWEWKMNRWRARLDKRREELKK